MRDQCWILLFSGGFGRLQAPKALHRRPIECRAWSVARMQDRPDTGVAHKDFPIGRIGGRHNLEKLAPPERIVGSFGHQAVAHDLDAKADLIAGTIWVVDCLAVPHTILAKFRRDQPKIADPFAEVAWYLLRMDALPLIGRCSKTVSAALSLKESATAPCRNTMVIGDSNSLCPGG